MTVLSRLHVRDSIGCMGNSAIRNPVEQFRIAFLEEGWDSNGLEQDGGSAIATRSREAILDVGSRFGTAVRLLFDAGRSRCSSTQHFASGHGRRMDKGFFIADGFRLVVAFTVG